jgi:quercetin dioxygenase-like cupin family protein
VAARHSACGYRVQGGDVSPFQTQVGVSVFEPGGGAELSASSVDRVYVVAAGEMVITIDAKEHTLHAFDSCFIPAGEARAMLNKGVLPAVLVTVIPKP